MIEIDCRVIDVLVNYGDEHQCIVAVEELSELTKELCKFNRFKSKLKARDAIKEEVADVYVMLKQIQVMFNITDEEMNQEISYKIGRTIRRMKDAE